jgi:lipoprotein signal peptidase
MNAVMGCIASEKWWADRRVKHRTVVLVIVLFLYIWLLIGERLSPLEAAGMVVVIGLAAGLVIDRVVEPGRPGTTDLSALLQVVTGSGRP